MAGIIEDMKQTFRQGNIVVRLIYINVAVFVLGILLSVMLGLFNINVGHILRDFYLPAETTEEVPAE
mgnify:CR=1 FL=1